MKHASDCGRAFLTFFAIFLLISCANPGIPLPPELELPRRVGDLHATRKGDKISLSWTVPNETIDHQRIRHQGPTRICRSVDPAAVDCDHPAGEISAGTFPAPPRPNKGETPTRVEAHYADVLSSQLEQEHPADLLNYAVSVLNQSARSAGPSNIVQIPAAPTLAAPVDLQAQLTAEGISLHWTNPVPPNVQGLHFLFRIYRRAEDAMTGAIAG
jgi:hypothetical protein